MRKAFSTSKCLICVFLAISQTTGRLICHRAYGEGDDATKLLECEIDKSFLNRNLIPKPPACGTFVEPTLTPNLRYNLKEFPWIALLQYAGVNSSDFAWCTGVLINNRHVLTSAYCVDTSDASPPLQLTSVSLGEVDVRTDPDCQENVCNDPVQNIEVEEVIVPDEYWRVPKNRKHNIALIRLKENVTYSETVSPICLPSVIKHYSESEVGEILYASGWGLLYPANVSAPYRQRLVLTKVGSDACLNLYKNIPPLGFFKENHICAAPAGRANPCMEFGGVPLMYKTNGVWVVEGINSHTFGCGLPIPGIYTKSKRYDRWITSNLKP